MAPIEHDTEPEPDICNQLPQQHIPTTTNPHIAFSQDEKTSPPSPTHAHVHPVISTDTNVNEKDRTPEGEESPPLFKRTNSEPVVPSSVTIPAGAARRRIIPTAQNGHGGHGIGRKDFAAFEAPRPIGGPPQGMGLQLVAGTPGGPVAPKLLRARTFKQPNWSASLKVSRG